MQAPSTPAWQKCLVPATATVQDVIRNLDASTLQIALVVAEDNVLLGTVTDGDVRRALLRGLDLGSAASEVMFRSPLVVPPEMGREMVIHLMRANRMHQIPVVDELHRVVGLHLLDDVLMPSARPNPVLIMAGGFGRRLRPFTDHCPKPMLPVGGKPMLQHIIERAAAEGFCEFYVSLHYLGQVIEEHFGDGRRWGVNIRYLHETVPLGTAGALANMPQRDLPFIVTNGDVLTDIHYAEMLEFHLQQKAHATMAVRQHEWQNPFGVVRTQGLSIVGFEEKPVYRSHVNAGIYVLDPQVLEVLPPNEPCDMPTLFSRLAAQGRRTIAFPMHEPWMDVGRPEDLELARSSLATPSVQARRPNTH